jgi:hypothetical protein
MKDRSLVIRRFACAAACLFAAVGLLCSPSRHVCADNLAKTFVTPPSSARPWVYWFWLNGNITKVGITADLEAMQRVGIGGVLIMEVDQGAPRGPVPFASPQWRTLFKFACSEANRLGLQINMTNDAGWCGSGGPWITPDLSMQKVVWTSTSVTGGAAVNLPLPEPQRVDGFYEDIAVLAYPTPAVPYQIPDIQGKAAFHRQDFPAAPATYTEVPTTQVVPSSSILDLTSHFQNGTLTWNVPAGKWTVLRIGHTSTGVMNHPAPASGLGLETDKLSKAATQAQFAGLMAKLTGDVGQLAGPTLVTTHIDSWETGSQNWTPTFREDFKRLRGYDPQPYYPVITGQVVDSVEVSERFLWDLRETVADLLNTNYAGEMRRLANQKHLRLSIEAYGDCPTDDIRYGENCDEPMLEFWQWPHNDIAPEITSGDAEKWQSYPGTIKAHGDYQLAHGVQRFVFHRYAMQPWLDREPGMEMGPWGLHYERTETWWNDTLPWHTYLARCQYLLRQGVYAADICYVEPEGAPRSFSVPADSPAGYGADACAFDAVINLMSVKNGRIVLPSGMSYRLLVLSDSQTMTPELLRKVAALVKAGATVIAPRPVKSPSLSGYPACDSQVANLAAEVWGNCDGATVFAHAYGLGRVIWGRSPAQVLSDMNVSPDIAPDNAFGNHLASIHRRLANGTDLYFVANQSGHSLSGSCDFRSTGRVPEFWWPETGKIEPAASYSKKAGGTRVHLDLGPTESVFVAFLPSAKSIDPILPDSLIGATGSANAALNQIKIISAIYGVPGDPVRTRDVRAKAQALVDNGETEFQVARLAEGDDPAYMVVKTATITYSVGSVEKTVVGQDPDTISLDDISDSGTRINRIHGTSTGHYVLETTSPGEYNVKTASGRSLVATVPPLPDPVTLDTPWNIKFPPGQGAPPQITLAALQSWSDNADPNVQYFSGTATYTTTVTIPRTMVAPDKQVYLNLGTVKVIADVSVNGHDMGILWRAPYVTNITSALKPGANNISVQVTNLWINRMIGDEQLPEDSDRNPNGTLQSWPDWLQADKPSPTGRITFADWRLWHKGSPLQPSGLIGPVTLFATQTMPLKEIR